MPPNDTISVLTNTLQNIPEIRALFLSGSHGTGHADAFSDIDLVMVAPEGATDMIATVWQDAVAQTGEIVLWWDRQAVPVLINAITADWTRVDVLILKPDQMPLYAQDALKPLFDHDDLYATLPEQTPLPTLSPARFRHQVEDFIRILGLLPLAIGRQEYLNGVLGVSFMRTTLVDLMIAETAERHRGGILHLNRLITQEQKAALMTLPAAEPTRQAIIDANVAYATVFLPRARAMATKIGMEWPDRFEEVTWARLKVTLGVTRPYTPG